MKIVTVVPNSAERDIRVMKEAMTLAEAGHDVHVVGIQEPKYPSYRTTYKNKIEIYRVPHGDIVVRYRKTINTIIIGSFIAIAALLSLSILYGIYASMSFEWAFHIYDFIPTHFSGSGWTFALQISGVVLALLVAGYLTYRIVKFARRVMKELTRNSSLRKRARSIIRSYNTVVNIFSKRLALKNKLFDKITELEPDLIYCHEVTALPACAEAKKKLGVQLVYDAHEFYDGLEGDNAQLLNKYNEKLHTRYLKHVDKFVTVSSTILEFYNEKYPVVKGKGAILPNAVLTRDLPEYDGRLHAAAKLPSSRKILLYQGGISRPRMVHEVIQAAEMLPEDWSVVVMGMGRNLKEYKVLADKINKRCQKNSIMERMTPEMRADLKNFISYQYQKSNSSSLEDQLHKDEEKITAGLNIAHYAARSYMPFMHDFIKEVSHKISESKREALKNRLEKASSAIVTGVDSLLNMEAEIDDISYAKAHEMAFWRVYKKYEDELSLPPRCIIIPPAPQDELPMWTQGASIGIIPYPITSPNHWGCAPNKLWEYPSAGVPVLSTPSREIRALLQQYEFGWTISADPKAEEIALVVSRLSDEDLKKAKRNCRKFVQESNWGTYSEGWLKHVESARSANR